MKVQKDRFKSASMKHRKKNDLDDEKVAAHSQRLAEE